MDSDKKKKKPESLCIQNLAVPLVSLSNSFQGPLEYNFTLKIETTMILLLLERFSYDLEMKTREQSRNNKRMEIERFDWLSNRYKRAWLLVG